MVEECGGVGVRGQEKGLKRIRRTTLSEFIKDVLGDPDDALDSYTVTGLREGMYKVTDPYPENKSVDDMAWVVSLARLEDEDE